MKKVSIDCEQVGHVWEKSVSRLEQIRPTPNTVHAYFVCVRLIVFWCQYLSRAAFIFTPSLGSSTSSQMRLLWFRWVSVNLVTSYNSNASISNGSKGWGLRWRWKGRPVAMSLRSLTLTFSYQTSAQLVCAERYYRLVGSFETVVLSSQVPMGWQTQGIFSALLPGTRTGLSLTMATLSWASSKGNCLRPSRWGGMAVGGIWFRYEAPPRTTPPLMW